MFKLGKAAPVIGAAALLSSLVGAPAHASGTIGGGDADQPMPTVTKAVAACDEIVRNGSFEKPKITMGMASEQFKQADVPGWRTDDPKHVIEVWNNGTNVGVPDGKQFVELNATGSGDSIYQDIHTKASSKIYWSFWIRARDSSTGKDVDATQIHFARTPSNGGGGVLGAGSGFAYSNSASDVRWKRLSGWYMTGSGQTMTRLTLTAVSSASTDEGMGNLVDGVSVTDHMC